jgi:hypothetical protein
LHLFKITNVLDESDGSSKYKLQREYVFKANSPQIRILGVSVARPSNDCNRIYILGSDKKMNVIEIRRS